MIVDFMVSKASVIDLAKLITIIKPKISDAIFYGETLNFVN